MTDAEERFWTVLPPLIGVSRQANARHGRARGQPRGGRQLKSTLDYAYTVGGKVLNLPPFPGTVSRYEQGVQWLFANGLTLRINLPHDTDE
jgi:hypothetical protein